MTAHQPMLPGMPGDEAGQAVDPLPGAVDADLPVASASSGGNSGIRWVVGICVVIVAVVVGLASLANRPDTSCKGGPDRLDPLGATYVSDDNVHWTVTYPCTRGGSTTKPIPRRLVPGVGR